jgi:SAM-dependent methyltransferase
MVHAQQSKGAGVTGFVFDIWTVLVLLGLAVAFLLGLWHVIPRWHGIPPTASRARWIRKALHLVDLEPGETIYDLGAGDGRVLTIAAREFGARAVGYEIEPLHCIVSWFRALFGGVITRVSIRRKDLHQADLSQADVVFLHLNPVFVENLRPLLESQLRPGARLVSLDFPFEGWEPANVDVGYLIFAYEMPPAPGGIDTYLQKSFGEDLTQSADAAKIDRSDD